jgi:site-specific DNA-adenine methylase
MIDAIKFEEFTPVQSVEETEAELLESDPEEEQLKPPTQSTEEQIAVLRAREQEELRSAIPNIADYPDTYADVQGNMPDNLYAKYKTIYDKYDLLIRSVSAQPTENKIYGSFGTDKEMFDAYVSGGLEAVKELARKRKEENAQDYEDMKYLNNLLVEFEALEVKENLTESEKNRLVDVYTELRDKWGMSIDKYKTAAPKETETNLPPAGTQLDMFDNFDASSEELRKQQEEDERKEDEEDNNCTNSPFLD